MERRSSMQARLALTTAALTTAALTLLLAGCASITLAQVDEPAAQRVLIPTAGLSSSPAPLIAWQFIPHGSGPPPAVVMLHGCGGAYAHNGRLNARHRMWGRYLAAHGYVALLVDSFTSRGVREICTIPFRARSLREADRVGDAYATLAWLRCRPDVDPACSARRRNNA